MPIQIDWLNEKQNVITVRFLGKWNRHSYEFMVDTIKSMMDNVSHKVHLIHDFSKSHSTPRDLLAGLQYANKHLPLNQGLTVFLNANSVIQAYVLMAKHTGLPAASHIYYALSLEDSLSVIEKKAHRIQTG